MNKSQSLQLDTEYVFPYQIEYTHPYVLEELSNHIYHTLHSFLPYREVICICIGTDRSTGDSLGPLVGSLLARNFPTRLKIYGTLDSPVHALNLQSTIKKIKQDHPHALIMAVDACLGKYKSVGQIQIGLGPIKPGAGVNKKLPEVGQFHVTGIVNVAGFMEHFVLQNTRLNLVMKMAEIISNSILIATRQLRVS